MSSAQVSEQEWVSKLTQINKRVYLQAQVM